MSVIKADQYKAERLPCQVSDYMEQYGTRFSEICKIYLEGMTIEDIKFLKEEDLINLVPSQNIKHKLLMIILVRRYLFVKN